MTQNVHEREMGFLCASHQRWLSLLMTKIISNEIQIYCLMKSIHWNQITLTQSWFEDLFSGFHESESTYSKKRKKTICLWTSKHIRHAFNYSFQAKFNCGLFRFGNVLSEFLNQVNHLDVLMCILEVIQLKALAKHIQIMFYMHPFQWHRSVWLNDKWKAKLFGFSKKQNYTH